MWNRYFVTGLAPDPLLWSEHDPWLVLLSLVVSMGAAAVALHLAVLAREAGSNRRRNLALTTGALALASGVWAMHYIGMLAFAVCGQARFDLRLTALSILPCMGAAWVALRLLVRPQVSPPALLGGGVLVGAGIGAMHYIGMAASELAPLMVYDLYGFALSIVVAVLLAWLALWVRFGVQQHLPQILQHRPALGTALAGTVMGLAIAAMHYTGMAALRFYVPIGEFNQVTNSVPVQISLALSIAVVVTTLGLLLLAANASRRYHDMLLQSQRSESRQRAVLQTAVDAVIMIDAKGIVQSFNPAAEKLLGWRAEQVCGHNVNMLMPEPHRSAHDGYLLRHISTGYQSVTGHGREVQAQHQDGSLIPVRLAVGRVEQPDGLWFVGFLTDLRERYALEHERERSQEQLRSLVANLPGVAFRCRNDRRWSMLFISEAVCALTGWPAHAFIQGQIDMLDLIHPQDLARVRQSVDAALGTGLPYQVEYRIINRNQAVRWLSEHGQGTRDDSGALGWIDGIMLDVTDAKAGRAALESTLTAINRSRPAAEFDMQGRLQHANAHYLDLLGYTLPEVQGRPHSNFCPPDFAHSPAYAAFWQRLRNGEFQSGEFQRFGKDGRIVWLLASYNPIFDADGAVCKIIKFATDMTQRRAMEQDLRAAKERAEAAAAARASFLANMSHEIRTPMNAIIGFSEALLDTPLSSTQQRQLGTVHSAARSLLRLLNDILDTAKLDKGAMALEVRDFSLRQLCQQTLDTLRINAHKKGLQLQLDYPSTEPEYLRGDALRLQQILLNLLGNAIKFTERGQVRLQVHYQAPILQLQVQDSGIGMSAEQLARVFDAFAQADASTTRRFGGTGLGTTIARQLAELMGGDISAQSTPGVGSTFTLSLPLPLGQAPQDNPAHDSAAPITLRPLHILAVDDVAANLELLQVALERRGHRLTLAQDGAQAVALCQAQHFDLVLMDLHMPGMDGLQATRAIRAQEAAQEAAQNTAQDRPHLPIIALSASVLEEDQGQALEAGMDGFACKPLDLPRLFAEIARLLPHAQAPAAPPPTTGAATGATTGADTSADTPIDWPRALSLWGEQHLHQALARLLREHPDLPHTLQALHTDPPALAQQAHRLRGLAGNLALGPLQNALAQLEGAARQSDAPAMAAALARLPTLWAQLQQALAAALPESLEPPAPTTAAHHNPPPEPTPNTALLQTALHQALAQLASGELPDQALLHTLQQLLAPAAWQSLQHALERFDLEQAQALLQTLHSPRQETA